MQKYKLSINQVYQKCDPNLFKVKSTQDIEPQTAMIGQQRVLDSINMAININNKGYNIFAMGEAGIGKQTIVSKLLETYALKKPTPKEWVYVNNFDNPNQPLAVSFSYGEGKMFKKHMKKLVEDIEITMKSVFNNQNYLSKINLINSKLLEKSQEKILNLTEKALKLHLSLIKKEDAFAIIPLNDKLIQFNEEEFLALSDKAKNDIEHNIKLIKSELEKIIHNIPQIQKETKNKIEEHNLKTTSKAISPLFKKIKKKWTHHSVIIKYLDDAFEYIIENYDIFLDNSKTSSKDIGEQSKILKIIQAKELDVFKVNIIVDRQNDAKNKKGAPIIVLDNPNYSRLFGKIEYNSQWGMLSTDINLLKAGALHLANGGYLVLNARKILEIPWLWESLKYTIKNQQIKFLSPEDNISSSNIASLDPSPIPLDVKIILIGEPNIYYSLWDYDPEFKELFKIVADFNSKVSYSEENILSYAKIISSIIKNSKSRHLEVNALAKLIEIAGRLSDSQKYLTSNFSKIKNMIIEANYIANFHNQPLIKVEHITEAYKLQKIRKSKISDYMEKNITDNIINIKTKGFETAQINGLAVLSMNDTMFGIPQRITSAVYSGYKGLINIERNVKLSGNIHSKGVMILQSFLYERFSKIQPLTFSASIVFEQSYGGIDGDSATCAELLSLLSGLSGVPLNQSLAITGSMDQKGNVQAIGGVNHKIEGFFKICKNKGLHNENGVVIPKSNITDLMLDDEILEAIKNGLFNIYAIEHIDEALEIFTNKQPQEINEIISNKWVAKFINNNFYE